MKQIYEGGNRDKQQLYGVPDRLSDRAIGGSIPVRGTICAFCSPSPGSGIHPSSYSVVLLSWSESQTDLPTFLLSPSSKSLPTKLHRAHQIIHFITDPSQNKKKM